MWPPLVVVVGPGEHHVRGELRPVAPTERSGLAAESAARAAFKQRGARRSRRSWPVVRISRMRVSKPIPERPTMTKLNPTPDGAVLVGIDIAKIRNEVLIEVGPRSAHVGSIACWRRASLN